MAISQQDKTRAIEYYNNAIAYMQTGNFSDGVLNFEKAADFGHPDAMQELTDLYLMPGVDRTAEHVISQLQKFSKSEFEPPLVLIALGTIYMGANRAFDIKFGTVATIQGREDEGSQLIEKAMIGKHKNSIDFSGYHIAHEACRKYRKKLETEIEAAMVDDTPYKELEDKVNQFLQVCLKARHYASMAYQTALERKDMQGIPSEMVDALLQAKVLEDKRSDADKEFADSAKKKIKQLTKVVEPIINSADTKPAKCANCGYIFDSGKFCVKCGAKIGQLSVDDASTQSANATNQLDAARTPISLPSKSPTAGSVSLAQDSVTPRKKSKMLAIVGAIAALLIVAVVFFVFAPDILGRTPGSTYEEDLAQADSDTGADEADTLQPSIIDTIPHFIAVPQYGVAVPMRSPYPADEQYMSRSFEWGRNFAIDFFPDINRHDPGLRIAVPLHSQAYFYRFFAHLPDDTLWAWGQNRGNFSNDDAYLLGTGTNDNIYTPVMILENVFSHTASAGVALKHDGSLWTWGRGIFRTIGDGTADGRNAPFMVLDNVVSAFDAGSGAVFALREDKTLWAWGNNVSGQVGNGERGGTQLYPVVILDDVVSIVRTSSSMAMALRSDNSLWAWGSRHDGSEWVEISNEPTMIMQYFVQPEFGADLIWDNGISFRWSGFSPQLIDFPMQLRAPIEQEAETTIPEAIVPIGYYVSECGRGVATEFLIGFYKSLGAEGQTHFHFALLNLDSTGIPAIYLEYWRSEVGGPGIFVNEWLLYVDGGFAPIESIGEGYRHFIKDEMGQLIVIYYHEVGMGFLPNTVAYVSFNGANLHMVEVIVIQAMDHTPEYIVYFNYQLNRHITVWYIDDIRRRIDFIERAMPNMNLSQLENLAELEDYIRARIASGNF